MMEKLVGGNDRPLGARAEEFTWRTSVRALYRLLSCNNYRHLIKEVTILLCVGI